MREINKAMRMLADAGAMFIGQGVASGGVATYADLEGIPAARRIELPVAEELQLGMATGMALAGLLPVAVYPRCDFLMRAMDKLVNHLDKLAAMSQGQFNPKVIIRARVGARWPLNAGPQHSQNHAEAFRTMLTAVRVHELTRAVDVADVYREALAYDGSTLVVEAVAC